MDVIARTQNPNSTREMSGAGAQPGLGRPSPSLMSDMTCIEDLRRAARRRVPRVFFGYADGGSYTEQTLEANRRDLEGIKLRQRVLVDVSGRQTTTTIV